ncbi:MAG: hypothetical protein OEM45_09135 [Gammaproteobacteria bacterium]|nr:hypothetical protein [Gammaproteobacteria bacterium]MDH3578122.1 hypothetical protein [Gammaproteobacteria bacterium]
MNRFARGAVARRGKHAASATFENYRRTNERASFRVLIGPSPRPQASDRKTPGSAMQVGDEIHGESS